MRPILIELPWPDSGLSPNSRLHWRAKADKFSAAKSVAFHQARKSASGERIAKKIPLKVEWTFYPPDRRKRDVDNLLGSCKAYSDGIAEALDLDDSRFNPVTVWRCDVEPSGQVLVLISGETP